MLLDLRYYGDPVLRKKSAEIKEINEEIRQLAKDLIETVFFRDGAGLSAPQVGRLLRIFVIRYDNGEDQEGMPILCPPKIYINPKISHPSKEMITSEEGCLSIPGVYGKVTRPETITVEALSLEGTSFTEEATMWRARVIMHENDHLNGTFFTDRLPSEQKREIEPALKDLKKKHHPSAPSKDTTQ